MKEKCSFSCKQIFIMDISFLILTSIHLHSRKHYILKGIPNMGSNKVLSQKQDLFNQLFTQKFPSIQHSFSTFFFSIEERNMKISYQVVISESFFHPGEDVSKD